MKRSSSERVETDSSDGARVRGFIPDMTQIKRAAKDLPNADQWPDASVSCPLKVGSRHEKLTFVRKSIRRGESRSYRWVYEGRIMIRNRDIVDEPGTT